MFNKPYSNSIAPLGYRGHSVMIEVSKGCYLADDEVEVGPGFAVFHTLLAKIYWDLLDEE